MVFLNRKDAGQQLAQRLTAYHQQPDVLVLGLARGGVPVAFEIAQQLQVPLDVFIVRKLGVPGHSEMAMGAIASGGVQVLNTPLIEARNVTPEVLQGIVEKEKKELNRRETLYRGDRKFPELRDSRTETLRERTIILVDDGIATGATLRVAALAIKQKQPKTIIAAVPVSSPQTGEPDYLSVDEVVCLQTPDPLNAISLWYEDFSQVSDQTVQELLDLSNN